MGRNAPLSLLVATLALLPGCDGRARTAVGGLDDACVSASRRLALLPKGVSAPVGRGATASYAALGRDSGPGSVHVGIELRNASGTVLARQEQDVARDRSHPHGEACDGDGSAAASPCAYGVEVAARGYRGGMPTIATNTRVSLDELLDFVRTRHHMLLVTKRADGSPQVSPVTGGVSDGRIVISTYPDRAKTNNLRRDPQTSVLVLSDEWNGAWVQVDGTAEVLDMPSQEAEDGLVEYFRCISGEHSDWDDYRRAMRDQGKSLVRITPERWGPVATGGFPPDRAPAS